MCAQSFLYMAIVLIVDSQAGVRQQVVRLLAQAGHRATAVATVSEATSLLQLRSPTCWRPMPCWPTAQATNVVQQAEAAGAQD